MKTLHQEPVQSPSPGGARRLSPALVLWLLLLVLASAAVLANLNQAKNVLDVLAGARWQFLLAAAGLEVVFAVNLGLFYAATLRATGVRVRLSRLVLIAQAGYFVNLVSKTGGLGGIGLYLQEARRSGQSSARMSAAYLLAFVLGYAAYLAVLIAVLLLLLLQGNLSTSEGVAAAFVVTLILVIGGFIFASLQSEAALEKMYSRLASPANAIARVLRRPPFVDPGSARKTASELYEAVDSLKRRPRAYALPLVHALAIELVATALLYVAARSVGAHISLDHALAVYAISLLFSMIAVTPSGLGFVEASLSVLLISFGVERQTAIAAALAYRLFEFWLPVALGIGSLALLHSNQRNKV
jgi:uncharacterized protein (TIRG00374 family)